MSLAQYVSVSIHSLGQYVSVSIHSLRDQQKNTLTTWDLRVFLLKLASCTCEMCPSLFRRSMRMRDQQKTKREKMVCRPTLNGSCQLLSLKAPGARCIMRGKWAVLNYSNGALWEASERCCIMRGKRVVLYYNNSATRRCLPPRRWNAVHRLM